MCSGPLRPLGFTHPCRSRPRGSVHSLLPSQLYLDHSHCPVLVPATLAALPSTRVTPDRDVFYVADPSAPLYLGSSRCARPLPRGVTGHVAQPVRSIEIRSSPNSLIATLATLPSTSLIPSAPLDEASARNGPILARCCAREHVKRAIFVAL